MKNGDEGQLEHRGLATRNGWRSRGKWLGTIMENGISGKERLDALYTNEGRSNHHGTPSPALLLPRAFADLHVEGRRPCDVAQ